MSLKCYRCNLLKFPAFCQIKRRQTAAFFCTCKVPGGQMGLPVLWCEETEHWYFYDSLVPCWHEHHHLSGLWLWIAPSADQCIKTSKISWTSILQHPTWLLCVFWWRLHQCLQRQRKTESIEKSDKIILSSKLPLMNLTHHGMSPQNSNMRWSISHAQCMDMEICGCCRKWLGLTTFWTLTLKLTWSAFLPEFALFLMSSGSTTE